MKKIFSIPVVLFSLMLPVSGQTPEFHGKPIAEIFTDFHVNISDTTEKTGFALNRAYLGYQFLPEGSISGKIIINIGTPEDLAAGSEPRRYAYCREASLTWSRNNLSVTMGITGTRIFQYQQNFWGKRYLAKPYQAMNGYGTVADLGIAADYYLNDMLKFDMTIMNGEGYSNIQLDNNFRTSLGLTITPGNKIAVRLYGDIQKAERVRQTVLIGFAGFKNDILTIGGEVSYKSNIDMIQGHHAWGLSATGSINLTKKTELFSRFDYISSAVMKNDILKWNYKTDGTFFIGGIQFKLNEYVKAAIDYQGRFPYSPGGQISDLIYLNLLFKL